VNQFCGREASQRTVCCEVSSYGDLFPGVPLIEVEVCCERHEREENGLLKSFGDRNLPSSCHRSHLSYLISPHLSTSKTPATLSDHLIVIIQIMSGLGTHTFTIRPTIWTRTDARHLFILCSCYLRPRGLRDIHSPWGHLHGRRGNLYCGLYVSRKWNRPCCRDRRHATSPLVDAPQLTVGRSDQIHKFWSAYNPNVLLKVFQTPPRSIIVPGLAGMTLLTRFSAIDPVSQMPMAISSNGALRCSSLSKAARRSMVPDKQLLRLSSRLMLVCRCAPKDKAIRSCSSGCTSRSHSLDRGNGLGSN